MRPPAPHSSLFGEGAVVVHRHNVLDQMDRTTFRARAEGTTLRDVAPVTTLPTVCVLNGEYVHPADWELVEPVAGDVVGFLTLPKGGGGGGSLQVVLGIVLIVVGAMTFTSGGGYLMAAGFGLLVSGMMPVPSFVPLVGDNSSSPSPTYNISLSGNAARLGQPLPVLYGRHVMMPDFAAPPYTEYDSDGDQYYHCILCLGVMDKFTLESIMIDDTVIDHFVGFQTQLIGPQYGGAQLTLVDPAVVTAPEVASQELLQGEYVGPFASCGPGLKTAKIGVDMVLPKGLYAAQNDGSLAPKSAQFVLEARAITDSGSLAGNWFPLGIETITATQTSTIRRTFTYSVDPARYEVRVQRQDAKDTSPRVGHELTWAGMRSYLVLTSYFDPSANFLALRIKANNQLSGLSQRKISVICRRHLPVWDGSTWTTKETRSIAWALADVLRNADYSLNLPDSRIDLATLLALDALWSARGDFFDGVFDKRVTVWAALTSIAKCGRARPLMRGSVFTFVRDGAQNLPTAVFGMRNIVKGSFTTDYRMVTEDAADALELEYFDQDTWQASSVTMNLPGVTGDPVNVVKVSLMGISHKAQAQRECAYMAADSAYRPQILSFSTEMEGFLPAFGDLIGVSHDVAGWGISGEIEKWAPPVATCTEDLTWSVGSNYAVMTDKYGDVHGPFLVEPGPGPRTMRFAETVTMVPYVGMDYERTKFAMGPASAYVKPCKVLSLTPDSKGLVKVRAVVEDGRVHLADLAYPGRGNGPGGGFVGGGGAGGPRVAKYATAGVLHYDQASDSNHNDFGFYTDLDLTVGANNDQGYVYGT